MRHRVNRPDRPRTPERHRQERGPARVGSLPAHVSGRGVFMEELLAELERRGVAFLAEEVGKKEGTGGDS
jgi:hypothetical protein